MASHLEVPFESNGIIRNATVQLERNGAYVTLEGVTVYIERRIVEKVVGKWHEVEKENQ